MKKLVVLLLFLASLACYPQEDMPDVFSVSSQFERVEVVRMKTGTDLLEGLNRIVSEKNIKNGVILNGIGSVTDYHFML